jgi:DNA-binding MarR family transcriptional regulator
VTGDEDDDLSGLSTAFMTASRALVGISLRSIQAAPVEITAVQHRVLVLLAGHGDMAVGALAEQLGVNPSNASRVCDRLQRMGLVDRVRAPEDGRTVCVHLTRSGTRVLDAVTERRRQEIQRVLGAMGLTDARDALRVMEAFAAAADEHAVDQ